MSKIESALVTGSQGFIGRPLVSSLQGNGIEVARFDRELDPRHDICDLEIVSKAIAPVDAVFHLAGKLGTEQNGSGPAFARTNVLGSVNVFDGANNADARVVFASKTNPWTNMYSASKGAADRFADVYRQVNGTDIRTGRMFNLYGPGQAVGKGHPIKAVPTFIMQALTGDNLVVYGSGEQTVDPMYVDDAALALTILGTLESDAAHGLDVELGTGEEFTVNDLAGIIISLCNSRSKIEHIPMRPGESDGPSRIRANTTTMNTVLGFVPEVSIEEGSKETVKWYRHMISE